MRRNDLSKPVLRICVETGEETRFPSRTEAAYNAPCSWSVMGTWLKDGREHYGYVWRYAEHKYGETRRGSYLDTLTPTERARRAATVRRNKLEYMRQYFHHKPEKSIKGWRDAKNDAQAT